MTLHRSDPSLAFLLLFAAGMACMPGGDDLPAMETSSGPTTAVADSSTGANESATSTTGRPPATSSSTTLDASTSAASDDTGTEFIITPDGGGCLLTGEFEVRCSLCDLAAQDCPDGEKCVPWANDGGDLWNSQRCSPVPGDPAGLGEPCVATGSPVSGIDDCGVGALCFGVDPRTLQGTCAPLCDPYQPDQVCTADEVCAADDAFAPYVCLSRCNPFDQAACPPDEACRVLADQTLCVPTVILPDGVPCGATAQSCAADQACLYADELAICDDGQCCRPWCDLSAPDPDLPCAAVPGEVCRPLSDAPAAGLEHVGVCALPL